MHSATTEAQVWHWLEAVADPEIPVVSVVDLGIVRAVRVSDDSVSVDVAPTYSGCPATEVIEAQVEACLRAHGFDRVVVERVLSPPWTTDWISESGRRKLLDFGIAPPAAAGMRTLLGKPEIGCPRCGSVDTSCVSEFGATACKAAYRCNACLEPFEYFKCL